MVLGARALGMHTPLGSHLVTEVGIFSRSHTS
jgi:hypothetical protein